MKNFVALGKVQVCIFFIFCILQPNFLSAAPAETQEDGIQPAGGHHSCGDGKDDPVDTNKLWKDNCFDVDGKSYQEGEHLTSCSGCLKFICHLKVQKEDPECEKYGWEKILEDECCQDCHGQVFPAGSVMKEQKLMDKCATTVTTKCAFLRGGTKVTIWESSSYEKCCINSEGVQPLNTTKLVPKLCSIRTCVSQSGNQEPSYALTKTAEGCNCCEYEGKLYADGTKKMIKKQEATCCEGRWVVELMDLPPETMTPCFDEHTNIAFHDLGRNRQQQDDVAVWAIHDGGKLLTQFKDTRPSIGITSLGIPNEPVKFSGRVYSKGSDIGIVGMVFGYQDETNFFVVASESYNTSIDHMNWYVARIHPRCGQSCVHQTDISDAITYPHEFPRDITVFATGTQNFINGKKYEFSINFNPSKLLVSVDITIGGGQQVFKSGDISVATGNSTVDAISRNGGRIGVYVDSKKATIWDILKCQYGVNGGVP